MSRPCIGFKPVRAEGTRTMYRWDGKPQRQPRKGEYFLSGSEVVAYRAGDDYNQLFFMAVPALGPELPALPDAIRDAIADVRKAAAESRNLKLDSPLWQAIARLCALTET